MGEWLIPGRITTGEWSHLPPQSVLRSDAAYAPAAVHEISIAAHRMKETATSNIPILGIIANKNNYAE